MLTKADDYPIHQTPEPIAYAGSDRNFYDRYFFNGYSTDGEVYFAAALGVYPHLNIIDAAFGVRIGEVQYNLRASRHLAMERMDTQVGPIRIEVIEPLRRLRIVVSDNAHPIAADLVFEGRAFPFEEPRNVRRNGPRTLMDLTRMTQLGRYSGWIRAGGRDIRFSTRTVLGTRDRSWGVRPVGERDPQAAVPALEPQFHWFWAPANFADRSLLFYVNEDAEGHPWNLGLMTARDGGEAEHLDRARIAATFRPGTRWPTHAVISAEDRAGGATTIEVEPGAKFFLTGIGYMHPEWGHGTNHGPLAVAYDEMRESEATAYAPPYLHVQAFAKVTLHPPDGPALAGHGALESLSFGRHAPSGFTGFSDAP